MIVMLKFGTVSKMTSITVELCISVCKAQLFTTQLNLNDLKKKKISKYAK